MMSVLVDATLRKARRNYTFDGSTLTTIVDANCDPVRFRSARSASTANA